MKYIITADLHIHPHYNNPIFINIGLDYLNYLKNYCLENNINNILLLGDIFHVSSKINIETFIPVFEKIEEIKNNNINIILLPGNHEIYNNDKRTILDIFKPFSCIKNEYEVNDTFHFYPFKRSPDLSEIKLNTDKLNILLTHIDIADFKLTNITQSKGIKDRSVLDKFDWVFSGHFHIYQQQKNIVYVGSPYQLNFGEENQDKGFIVYDTNNNTWIREIYDNAPKFKTLTVEQSLKEKEINNCFVKLKINNKIDNLSKLREILYDRGAINIEQEFENSFSDTSQFEQIKLSNNSLSDILEEFINQDEIIKIKKLNKEDLIKILNKIITE
jgi:DNA repair exonuclease SbcCD nuclease subunit